MKTEKIGGHVIELYNSIDELTADRFSLYNRMLLIDSGIGSDMEAIDTHITKLIRYINADKKEEATQELMNMRNSFYFVTENTSPKFMSYAALIYSIDGNLMTDLSDENLNRVLVQLNHWGATKGFFDNAIDVLKKKLLTNWKRIFRICSKAR